LASSRAAPGIPRPGFRQHLQVCAWSAAWISSPIAMIIEIHVARLTFTAVPAEYETPLLVHPDRMPAGESAFELFEMVAGRHTKVGIGPGIIQHLQPSE